MFFSNSFYICSHRAVISFLILTSPLSFFVRLFNWISLCFNLCIFCHALTRPKVSPSFRLFLALFWMLWMLVTVFHSCHVPHASGITTLGTFFTEPLFSVSKEWVISWLYASLIICGKTFAKRLKEVRPKSYWEEEKEKE